MAHRPRCAAVGRPMTSVPRATAPPRSPLRCVSAAIDRLRTFGVTACNRASHGAHGNVRLHTYSISRAQPAHLFIRANRRFPFTDAGRAWKIRPYDTRKGRGGDHNEKALSFCSGPFMEAPSGFEPENRGFAVPCLTTWLWRRRRCIAAGSNLAPAGVGQDFHLPQYAPLKTESGLGFVWEKEDGYQ